MKQKRRTRFSGLFVGGLLAMTALAFVSCGSENEIPAVKENELPEAIARDFNSRYGDNAVVEHVYTGYDM